MPKTLTIALTCISLLLYFLYYNIKDCVTRNISSINSSLTSISRESTNTVTTFTSPAFVNIFDRLIYTIKEKVITDPIYLSTCIKHIATDKNIRKKLLMTHASVKQMTKITHHLLPVFNDLITKISQGFVMFNKFGFFSNLIENPIESAFKDFIKDHPEFNNILPYVQSFSLQFDSYLIQQRELNRIEAEEPVLFSVDQPYVPLPVDRVKKSNSSLDTVSNVILSPIDDISILSLDPETEIEVDTILQRYLSSSKYEKEILSQMVTIAMDFFNGVTGLGDTYINDCEHMVETIHNDIQSKLSLSIHQLIHIVTRIHQERMSIFKSTENIRNNSFNMIQLALSAVLVFIVFLYAVYNNFIRDIIIEREIEINEAVVQEEIVRDEAVLNTQPLLPQDQVMDQLAEEFRGLRLGRNKRKSKDKKLRRKRKTNKKW